MNLRLILMLISDALLAVAALFTAVVLRLGVEALRQEWLRGDALLVFMTFLGCSLFSSYLMELYSPTKGSSRWEIVLKSLRCGCASFFFLAFAYYIHPEKLLGQGLLFISLSLFCLYQSVWHLLSRSHKEQPAFSKKVLILGTDQVAVELGNLVASGNLFTLAGFVNYVVDRETTADGTGSCSSPVMRMVELQDDLLATARRENVDVIVVALPERRGMPLQEIMQCKLSGIEVFDAAAFYEILQGKLMLEHISPSYVLSSGLGSTRLVSFLKRCIDVLLSAAALVLFLPFFPMLALIIKLQSPGPVFLKQMRVGGSERPFLLYKFRISFQDRDGELAESFSVDNAGELTAFSRFIRRSGVEQIPQLYNVLKGEMSLVGPRPERPEFVETLKKDISYYSKRHTIKPGITGWAQVRHPHGSSREDAVEKLCYDLYYIKNLSPSLDSQIVFETVKEALFGRGRR